MLRSVSVIFQETFLFSTTVAENIAYGSPKATLSEIEAAARLAQAHEFIEKAALDWFASYRQRIARGEIAHQPRGDARIRQGAFTADAAA